jgi:hypothetical protein
MKKIRLDIAALEVASFESVPQSGTRGTVEGHASRLTCYPNATCGTCGDSCQQGSCAYTCDVGLTGEPCVYC